MVADEDAMALEARSRQVERRALREDPLEVRLAARDGSRRRMRFGSCHALLALEPHHDGTSRSCGARASAEARKTAFGKLRRRPKTDIVAISAIVRYDPPPMNRLMLDYNVLYIVLVAAGLVFFGAVFLSTRPAQRAKPVRIDAWMGREVVWFAVVIVILVGSLAATIGHTPWSASAKADRQIVEVAGVQYGFKFSTTTMHVGRQVEFHLTATDVNHGFAVFDPSGTFVAQAQMMPGYDTVLRLTFTKPGQVHGALLRVLRDRARPRWSASSGCAHDRDHLRGGARARRPRGGGRAPSTSARVRVADAPLPRHVDDPPRRAAACSASCCARARPTSTGCLPTCGTR